MKQKRQVHMLPTEDETLIRKELNTKKLKLFYDSVFSRDTVGYYPCQHLYFTSDEKPKKGDYAIVTSAVMSYKDIIKEWGEPIGKKIIATTDPKLTIERYITGIDPIGEYSTAITQKVPFKLPQIPQSFIKSFCEKGGIWEVEVKYDEITETKQDKYSDGTYARSCSEQVVGYKLKLIDNTIVINEVEEKMYSEDALVNAIINFANNHLKVRNSVSKSEVIKWIKENL